MKRIISLFDGPQPAPPRAAPSEARVAPWSRARRFAACLAAAGAMLAAAPGSARAQGGTPTTVAGGHLTFSGNGSAAVATPDDAYFDYSSYDYNLMRSVRLDGAADLRVTDRLSLLGDVRVEGSTDGEGAWAVRPYALFARFRPWPTHAVDIQAGLVPPVFGTFSRHTYDTDNPVIGFPLAYQYITSLRPDALAASADELLRMRGRGWLTRYALGDQSAGSGVPVVDGLRYQTGVEVHAGDGQPFEAGAAWTAGSLSVPTLESGNAWKQVSGRFAARPAVGLVLGVSASSGRFLAGSLIDEFGGTSATGDQRAVGFDAEYSRGYWLFRTEGVLSSWRVPAVRVPLIDSPLRAFGIDVEGRYRIGPGLYVAARLDRLDFSEISTAAGLVPWDAPVRRIEIGTGYSPVRNAVVKVAWQHNRRELTGTTDQNVVAAQLLVWF